VSVTKKMLMYVIFVECPDGNHVKDRAKVIEIHTHTHTHTHTRAHTHTHLCIIANMIRQQQQQGNERTEYLFNIKNSKPGHIKIENNTRILSLAPQTNFYNKK